MPSTASGRESCSFFQRKGTKPIITVLTPEEAGTEAGEAGPSVIDRLVLEVQEAADSEAASSGRAASPDINVNGENPPAYTREPEPLNKQELLVQAHPCRNGVPSDEDDSHVIEEAYDAVVRATGSRCLPIEEKMDRRRKDRARRGMGGWLRQYDSDSWLMVARRHVRPVAAYRSISTSSAQWRLRRLDPDADDGPRQPHWKGRCGHHGCICQ